MTEEIAQSAKPGWAILVAEALHEQGRTQKWLAARVGMNADSLYHLTRGDVRYRRPSAALLERIALALGKPASWLVGEAEGAVAGGTPARARRRRAGKPLGVLAEKLGKE